MTTKAKAAIINYFDSEPITLTSALSPVSPLTPWDLTPPKSQDARTIEAMTEAFATIVIAAEAISTAITQSAQGAEYAEQALEFTLSSAIRAKQEIEQSAVAPFRRYPDINAAKHRAKANHYTAQAKADASLTLKAFHAAATANQSVKPSQDQISKAAHTVYTHAAELPDGYEECVTNITLKTKSLVQAINAAAAQASSNTAKAKAAADKAKAAVEEL